MSSAQNLLETVRFECRRLKTQAEKAIDQVRDDDALTQPLDPESNSVVILVQHLGGNLVSRWTDFLESDGEKPSRQRDREFEPSLFANRAALFERWNQGFGLMAGTLDELKQEDLTRTVQIRGESFSVQEAIVRNLLHISFHVGQIVLLCKHIAGPDWRTLSIPRGQSEGAKGGYKGRASPPERG